MNGVTGIGCACGQVRLEVAGRPLIVAECCCNSCRAGAARMAAGLPGAPHVANDHGGTHYVLYRKDRVRLLSGVEHLHGFRLTPEAPTRRVVATCCDTPVFVEFKGGHWLSLYAGLWPSGTAPAPELRTQTGDLPEGIVLPDDGIPAGAWPTAGFYGRLLTAWIAMGFRVPKVEIAGEDLRI